jgi:hypothetical protein
MLGLPNYSASAVSENKLKIGWLYLGFNKKARRYRRAKNPLGGRGFLKQSVTLDGKIS